MYSVGAGLSAKTAKLPFFGCVSTAFAYGLSVKLVIYLSVFHGAVAHVAFFAERSAVSAPRAGGNSVLTYE